MTQKMISTQNMEKKAIKIPHLEAVKFIERTNGTIKGYAVNTFNGLVKSYNEDRVSIIMNITKPNFKGRWPRCSYFGVFDGHGGNKCSDFLKENMHKFITENSHFPHSPIEALKFGFKKAEYQFMLFAESQNPIERSGSCAIVLLIIDQICYIANVGDSRAIISMNGGKSVYSISKDHKPDSESEHQRIKAAGGKIYQSIVKHKNGQIISGPFRIEPGKLSVSRSFGDIEAKLQKYEGNPKVLIAKPQITYFEINRAEHDFIVMCSDGIYDKLQNEEVAECFWKMQREQSGSKINSFAEGNKMAGNNGEGKTIDSNNSYDFIGNACSRILERSMQKMSMDNLTSLIILFEDDGKLLMKHPTSSIKTLNKHIIKQSQNLQVQKKYNSNQNQNDCRKNMGGNSCKIPQKMMISVENNFNNQNNINQNNVMSGQNTAKYQNIAEKYTSLEPEGQKERAIVKRKSTSNLQHLLNQQTNKNSTQEKRHSEINLQPFPNQQQLNYSLSSKNITHKHQDTSGQIQKMRPKEKYQGYNQLISQRLANNHHQAVKKIKFQDVILSKHQLLENFKMDKDKDQQKKQKASVWKQLSGNSNKDKADKIRF